MRQAVEDRRDRESQPPGGIDFPGTIVQVPAFHGATDAERADRLGAPGFVEENGDRFHEAPIERGQHLVQALEGPPRACLAGLDEENTQRARRASRFA